MQLLSPSLQSRNMKHLQSFSSGWGKLSPLDPLSPSSSEHTGTWHMFCSEQPQVHHLDRGNIIFFLKTWELEVEAETIASSEPSLRLSPRSMEKLHEIKWNFSCAHNFSLPAWL